MLVDREVNVKTGTLTVKGFFPNPAQHPPPRPIRPRPRRSSACGRARWSSRSGRSASSRGLARRRGRRGRQGGDPRRRAGPRTGDSWVVEKGLEPGDNVIVTRPPVLAGGHADRGEAGGHRRPRRSRAGAADEPLLRRPPDRRHRDRGPHRDPGRGEPGRPARRPVPVDHPARHPDRDHLHRRGRPHHRAVGGHADRAADERRGQDALPPVHQRQRRDHDAVGDLRRGDRGQHRPGQRAEPGGPGPAQPARGREPVRPDLPQHGRPAPGGLRRLLAEGHLRLAVPRQLRGHQHQRRALPRERRGPGRQLRPVRVRHAHLGQARPAGQAGPDRARPRAGRAAAEHGEPVRAHRRGARPARAAAHLHRALAGTAGDAGGVRQRRGPPHAGRLRGAPARRGAPRAGRR